MVNLKERIIYYYFVHANACATHMVEVHRNNPQCFQALGTILFFDMSWVSVEFLDNFFDDFFL